MDFTCIWRREIDCVWMCTCAKSDDSYLLLLSFAHKSSQNPWISRYSTKENGFTCIRTFFLHWICIAYDYNATLLKILSSRCWNWKGRERGITKNSHSQIFAILNSMIVSLLYCFSLYLENTEVLSIWLQASIKEEIDCLLQNLGILCVALNLWTHRCHANIGDMPAKMKWCTTENQVK